MLNKAQFWSAEELEQWTWFVRIKRTVQRKKGKKTGYVSGGGFKRFPNVKKKKKSAVVLVMQREARAPGEDQ